MTHYGVTKPTNAIVIRGTPRIQSLKVETATNMYPGRFCKTGTNNDDVVVATALGRHVGLLGYEDMAAPNRPDTVDTIHTASSWVPVLTGNFDAVGSLAKGTYAYKGDLLMRWSNGQVVPVMASGGGYAVRIPFTKKTTEQTTYVALEEDMLVSDVFIDVSTAVASSTIDVGILSTETGGDADGFLDGESCAQTGTTAHIMADATAANNTLGALLVEEDVTFAGQTIYQSLKLQPGFQCDGTAKTISYTTSNHTIAGDIYVELIGELAIVGRCLADVDATAAAADVMMEVFA